MVLLLLLLLLSRRLHSIGCLGRQVELVLRRITATRESHWRRRPWLAFSVVLLRSPLLLLVLLLLLLLHQKHRGIIPVFRHLTVLLLMQCRRRPIPSLVWMVLVLLVLVMVLVVPVGSGWWDGRNRRVVVVVVGVFGRRVRRR